MAIIRLVSSEVAEFISAKTRRAFRKNYPNLWKLVLEEFDEFKEYSGFALLANEMINCGEYALVPCFIGMICNCFGFVPFTFTWLSVIFMVHYMTKDLHQQEYNESVVSPKLWIRCLANLLIGLLGFYFYEAPILPNNEGEGGISTHVKAWSSLIFSCFATACEDFGFYRLYIAIMKGIAVTYRILNTEVSTSFLSGDGNADLMNEGETTKGETMSQQNDDKSDKKGR